MKSLRIIGLFTLLLTLFLLLGCPIQQSAENAGKLEFKTSYQVVFLDNNNAYIGKLQQINKDFLRLDNVYYIQTQVSQETRQVKNALTKRGNELHEPDFMYINTQHVLMIEPVTPDSQVAKLITQVETQKPSGEPQQPETDLPENEQK